MQYYFYFYYGFYVLTYFYFDFDALFSSSYPCSLFFLVSYLTSFYVKTRDYGFPFGPMFAPMEINLGTFLCFWASCSKLGLYSISCFKMFKLNYSFTLDKYFYSSISFNFQVFIKSYTALIGALVL